MLLSALSRISNELHKRIFLKARLDRILEDSKEDAVNGSAPFVQRLDILLSEICLDDVILITSTLR